MAISPIVLRPPVTVLPDSALVNKRVESFPRDVRIGQKYQIGAEAGNFTVNWMPQIGPHATPRPAGTLFLNSAGLADGVPTSMKIARVRFYEPGSTKPAATVRNIAPPKGEGVWGQVKYPIQLSGLKLDPMKQYIAVIDFRVDGSKDTKSVRTGKFGIMALE